MGQLLVPALIGAGVGAVGGAVSGQNPFKTALLGGALGTGSAGLMGAGAAGGATAGTVGTNGLIGGANLTGAGVASGAGAGATGGLGNFLSSIKGVETTPVSFGTGGYASGIGGQVINAPGTLASLPGQTLDEALGYTIPKQNLADVTSPEAIANSAFPKFEQSGFNNLGAGPNVSAPFSTEAFANNPLMQQQIANNAGQVASTSFLDNIGLGNLTTMDKIGLGKTALDVAMPQQQQQAQAPIPPILRGNFDPSSALVNVSPNVKPGSGAKVGLIDMMASIPLTDEERMRLQQLGYRG